MMLKRQIEFLETEVHALDKGIDIIATEDRAIGHIKGHLARQGKPRNWSFILHQDGTGLLMHPMCQPQKTATPHILTDAILQIIRNGID